MNAVVCMSGLGRETVGTGAGEDAKGNRDGCGSQIESSSPGRSAGFLPTGSVCLGAGRSDAPTPAVIPGLVEVKLLPLEKRGFCGGLAKKPKI